MKKLYSLMLCGMLCAIWAEGAMAQSAIATGGTSIVNGAGYTFSYTMGQSAFAFTTGSIEEGVQQVFCVPQFDTVYYSVCENHGDEQLAALLPVGITPPAEVLPNVPGDYTFVMALLSSGGCDSMVVVNLRVNPVLDTMIYAQTENCYTFFGSELTLSGEYSDTITSMAGCDSIVNLTLAVMETGFEIPKIFHYNERVLMVNRINSDGDTMNYYDYRWLRDGIVVSDGPDADSYQDNGNILSGCYKLQVATDPELKYWATSNTICLNTQGIIDAEKEIKLSIYPNPARAGSDIRVIIGLEESELQGAKLIVYDAQGRPADKVSAHSNTHITAKYASGIYLFSVILPDGRRASRRLVVR